MNWLVSVLTWHVPDVKCLVLRCHGPVATLLRPRGNVVMAPWQRCYGPVATLLWARGNVVMGPWQRMTPLRSMATCLLEQGMQGFLSDAVRKGRWLAYGGKKQPGHVKVLPSASIGSMPRGALRNTRPDR